MTVCLKCGDQGITDAFVYCCQCKLNAQHFYCLEQLPKTIDLNVQWFCHECKPENHYGQSYYDKMIINKPTLPTLTDSLTVSLLPSTDSTTVINKKVKTRHATVVRKEVAVIEVEVDLDMDMVEYNPVEEFDSAESGRSEDFLGDTDDEFDHKDEKSKTGKVRERDIAWMHAVKIRQPKHGLVCKYCLRAMTGRGSITRLKEHLAGGYDSKTIKECPKVPPEVKESMKKVVAQKEKLRAALSAKARVNGMEIVDFSGRIKVRKDPAWNYASPIDGKVNAMVCKFCSRTISGGGITRFKHHLAEKCINAPVEVQAEMANMLTKKDTDRATFDANVHNIKKDMRENKEQSENDHWPGLP